MSVIGWIRDLFGIQKDMYETKKTRLEIEKIEEEKREKLIALATLEDVKKYDPHYQELEESIRDIMDELHCDQATAEATWLKFRSTMLHLEAQSELPQRKMSAAAKVLGVGSLLLLILLLVSRKHKKARR